MIIVSGWVFNLKFNNFGLWLIMEHLFLDILLLDINHKLSTTYVFELVDNKSSHYNSLRLYYNLDNSHAVFSILFDK